MNPLFQYDILGFFVGKNRFTTTATYPVYQIGVRALNKVEEDISFSSYKIRAF